jgi:hypothetical protein
MLLYLLNLIVYERCLLLVKGRKNYQKKSKQILGEIFFLTFKINLNILKSFYNKI